MKKNLIEIPIHKGCIIALTPDEFARGLKRGKGVKRSRTQAEREAEKWAKHKHEQGKEGWGK